MLNGCTAAGSANSSGMSSNTNFLLNSNLNGNQHQNEKNYIGEGTKKMENHPGKLQKPFAGNLKKTD
jgi:hypothetical protein